MNHSCVEAETRTNPIKSTYNYTFYDEGGVGKNKDSTRMCNTKNEKFILGLAIARSGLRCNEKLLLWNTLQNETALLQQRQKDFENCVGRSLYSKFKPELWLQQAQLDATLLYRLGGECVFFDSSGYPPLLREIYSPPFCLYYRTASSALPVSKPALAIVGTRAATTKGITAAYRLAREAGECGIVIISGLARGIDAAAHRGALASPTSTWAVLPCGIDQMYPKANNKLAVSILEKGGGLISEYPPNNPLQKYCFPERNRIIAGLCAAVLVVEAPKKSGSLITARYALEEGRDLWVAGECLGDVRSQGIDDLESDGAPKAYSGFDIARVSFYLDTMQKPASQEKLLQVETEGKRLARLLGQELKLLEEDNENKQ